MPVCGNIFILAEQFEVTVAVLMPIVTHYDAACCGAM